MKICFFSRLARRLLAGVIGALAVRFQMSSSLRLVAVCPCMVLVPGPHFLNSALDLITGRLQLGVARFTYASLIVVAISAGLLMGLSGLGVSLPVDPAGRAVPFWQDVLAAGVAVIAYSVFFSTPWNMLPWPVSIGMIAHAARWAMLSFFAADAAMGALVACALVGVVLTPVSRLRHMPFAAIGFAAVVSLLPGAYLFRMMSGLAQIAAGAPAALDLLGATSADAMTAIAIIFAMSFGLIAPHLIVGEFVDRLMRRHSRRAV